MRQQNLKEPNILLKCLSFLVSQKETRMSSTNLKTTRLYFHAVRSKARHYSGYLLVEALTQPIVTHFTCKLTITIFIIPKTSHSRWRWIIKKWSQRLQAVKKKKKKKRPLCFFWIFQELNLTENMLMKYYYLCNCPNYNQDTELSSKCLYKVEYNSAIVLLAYLANHWLFFHGFLRWNWRMTLWPPPDPLTVFFQGRNHFQYVKKKCSHVSFMCWIIYFFQHKVNKM